MILISVDEISDVETSCRRGESHHSLKGKRVGRRGLCRAIGWPMKETRDRYRPSLLQFLTVATGENES